MTNTSSFFSSFFLREKQNITNCLLAVILASLVLKSIYTSISTIAFVCWVFFSYREKIEYRKICFWPIAYFLLMAFSLLWSDSFESSLSGLQKQLSFLFIPITFFFINKLTTKDLYKIVRIFSFGMAVFGLFSLMKAGIMYLNTQDVNVFFRNELVAYDPGAIYISVFASFALFYFIQIQTRTKIESFCLFIVALLIFLLASKSNITIDFIIIVCYYIFFSKIPSGTKTITIIFFSLFLFFSVFFVTKVRERFLIEYETAFIDNTLNSELTKGDINVYNVSVYEAWTKNDFHQNSFLPGTALRVFQLRVFFEILSEHAIFWTGFGLDASQEYIKQKTQLYNLGTIYGEYNFHNQFIQTFAELGIFGFLILISMLTINLRNAFMRKDFLQIAFAITMIILFLSESFFCRQRGIVFFIILFCLFNYPPEEETVEINQ